MTTYTFNVSDTTNNKVDVDKLRDQIEKSSITIALHGVSVSGTTISIEFKSDLSQGEQTTLSGLVSTHDGLPLPNYVTISKTGRPIVETSVRVGSDKENTISIVSIDFSDKTTWYQNSIKVTDEVLTISTPFTSAQTAHYPVINMDSNKLTGEESSFIDRTGYFRKRSYWRIELKVNSTVKVLGTDYTVNFNTGEITFSQALNENDVVTVTYNYVRPTDSQNGVRGSEFVIRPDGTDCDSIIMEHAEIQFSKAITFNDTLVCEIWAAPDNTYPFDGYYDAYFAAGYGQYQMKYRSIIDFINIGNEGKGSVPAVGGVGETLIFPFDYISAITLKYCHSLAFRVYLANDTPYTTCDFCTGTFYCIEEEK